MKHSIDSVLGTVKRNWSNISARLFIDHDLHILYRDVHDVQVHPNLGIECSEEASPESSIPDRSRLGGPLQSCCGPWRIWASNGSGF